MLSYRQEDILDALTGGPRTSYELTRIVGGQPPMASVRRDIGALRRAGYDIYHRDGLYHWKQPVANIVTDEAWADAAAAI